VGATPDQLEREIEEVRADLARTIGEIEERVRPQRVLRENKRVVIGIGLLVTALLALKIARKHSS
jgi:hypothetical protein